MNRLPKAVITLAILLIPIASAFSAATAFDPPRLLTASDIAYPITAAASGLVEIEIDLNSTGHIKDLSTIRDIPSLTAPSLLAIRNWTFTPATANLTPLDSTFFANVVFDAGVAHPLNIPLSPEMKRVSIEPDGFVPPRVAAASYAQYPINSIGTGAVVLEVNVDPSGHVSAASAVHPVPSLTKPAIAAVKTWTFKPGTLHHVPIAATSIVAFVFRAPNISTP